MKKFKLTLILTLFSLIGLSNTHTDSLFAVANEQYHSEKYIEAIDNYQAIIDSNFASYELYFNLANSYYQFGKIPLSIYYYEKALQLRKDEDAINNLSLAQNRITLIEPIQQLFYISWWNNLTIQLSQKMWAVLLITSVWLTSALLLLFIKNRRKWMFNGLLSSIILSFLLAALMYNANIHENKKYGIVLKESKLFDDNTNYQSSGSVDRGNKVRIIDNSTEMLQVSLLDGQKGWVEKNRVKALD